MPLVPLLLMLPAIARAQGPPPGYALRVSAQRYYDQTITRLIGTGRFEMSGATTYRVGGHEGTILDYLVPERLQLRNRTSLLQGAYVQTQIGSTICTWINAHSSPRVYCRHTAWSMAAVGEQVRQLLVPERALLTHRTYVYSWRSPRQYHKVIVVIHALGDPFACGLGADCPHRPIPDQVPYTGVLRVNRDTGLPDLFTSYVTENGRNWPAQLVTFRYDAPVSIALPLGKRVSCPGGTARNQWCLLRSG
jgi:hypothetical protein